MSNRFKNLGWKGMGTVTAVVALVLLLSLGLFGLVSSNGGSPAANINGAADPTETDEPPKEEPTKCASTWPMRKVTPKNGDWVNDVPSIRQASTKAEARAAAEDWLDKIKGHPETLKGAAAYILDEDVKVKVLVNDKGCATDRAENLVQEIETALALAAITPAEAPANGYNSFTNPNTGAVFAEGGPIGGDRSAIKIVLLNGKTVWVMARCGNPVTKNPPPIKHEPPKDNPPECKHNCNPPPPECPPGTVPYDGRCVKPEGENDSDGTGGNDSPMSQNPQDNPQGDTPGAPKDPPPPPDHNGSGDDNGSPGDGGAGPPQGPSDDDHAGDHTGPDPSDPGGGTDSPECPFGPGNC